MVASLGQAICSWHAIATCRVSLRTNPAVRFGDSAASCAEVEGRLSLSSRAEARRRSGQRHSIEGCVLRPRCTELAFPPARLKHRSSVVQPESVRWRETGEWPLAATDGLTPRCVNRGLEGDDREHGAPAHQVVTSFQSRGAVGRKGGPGRPHTRQRGMTNERPETCICLSADWINSEQNCAIQFAARSPAIAGFCPRRSVLSSMPCKFPASRLMPSSAPLHRLDLLWQRPIELLEPGSGRASIAGVAPAKHLLSVPLHARRRGRNYRARYGSQRIIPSRPW